LRALYVNNIDNNSNANGNNNLNNNNARFALIIQAYAGAHKMKQDLYDQLCSYNNLFLAYQKARKRKTLKPYVLEFEKNLKDNLLELRAELLFHTYRPKPLTTFILRDPKTRKISRSDFRDRIIHHAVCNVIEEIFEKRFIFDTYANRKGKGVLKAVQRFEDFSRKVTKNNTCRAYAMKADIRHYFETVNHNILLKIIRKIVPDSRMIWLITLILGNYKTAITEKGMPLGNLTSQFFANVYLGELDNFVKHRLRCKYYIRYVDDFVIFHDSRECLEKYKSEINTFLTQHLDIDLHPEKSRIIPLSHGIEFLGFKIFPYYKILKSKNLRKFRRKLCNSTTTLS
jgi:RNA-directed DNA polymerase